jgi:glycosyltransferase involved in cell wall biosynthesis
MSALKLTVVVCSYNQAPFLRQALESLAAQRDVTRDEFEVIAVDGGSTDGSADIIHEYESGLAWWVSERDRGQSHALNKGFARSSGNIQGWLCSDDVLEPHAARTVLDYFQSHPESRCVYGDAYLIDEQDRIVKSKREIPFNWFIWRYDYNYIPQPSTFWRSDLFQQVGGIDESLRVCMDGDLWARFSEVAAIDHVPTILSRMRLQKDQKTQRLKREGNEVQNQITSRYGVRNDRVIQRKAAFIVAKGMRVGWKAVTGCYR